MVAHAQPRTSIWSSKDRPTISCARRKRLHFGAPESVVEAVRSLGPTEVVFVGQPPLRIDFLRTIDGVSVSKLFGDAIQIKLDGVALKVIALDDLIANKHAVGRPQDLVDAKLLESVRSKA